MTGGPAQIHWNQRRRAWLGCGWFLLVGWIGLSLIPTPQLEILDGVDWGDKAAHAAAYTVLMWWFAQAYGRMRWPRIAGALLVLGFTLEFIQYLLPYRTAEGVDVLANAAGIACGWAGAGVIRTGILHTTS